MTILFVQVCLVGSLLVLAVVFSEYRNYRNTSAKDINLFRAAFGGGVSDFGSLFVVYCVFSVTF